MESTSLVKALALLEATAQAAAGLVAGNVNSISVDSSGALTLNLQGLGSVAMSQVRQIN